MTHAELEALEIDIASTQTKLKKLHTDSDSEKPQAVVDLIGELEIRLADLQNQYAAAQGEAKSWIARTRLDRGLPGIDEQIAYMKHVVDDLPPGWAEGMPSAIHQSLIAAKLLSDVKTMIADTEAVIMEIGRPYDLEACSRFIQKLSDKIGAPKNKAQLELLRMYTQLSENLYFAQWVAKCTADLLLHEPGNQVTEVKAGNHFDAYVGPTPTRAEDRSGKDFPYLKIDLVKRDGQWFAHGSEMGVDLTFSGEGDTESAAVKAMLEAREQLKQAELFPPDDQFMKS